MQGCTRSKLILLTVFLASLLTGQALAAGPAQLCSGLAEPDGLVLDSRGYAYTVCRGDGLVWCVPPDGEPVAYARVEAPTCLAVDRVRTVFVGTASGDIVAVLTDGTASRVHRCQSGVTGLNLDRDGNLVAVTTDGAITRIPRETFRLND